MKRLPVELADGIDELGEVGVLQVELHQVPAGFGLERHVRRLRDRVHRVRQRDRARRAARDPRLAAATGVRRQEQRLPARCRSAAAAAAGGGRVAGRRLAWRRCALESTLSNSARRRSFAFTPRRGTVPGCRGRLPAELEAGVGGRVCATLPLAISQASPAGTRRRAASHVTGIGIRTSFHESITSHLML